MPIYSIDCRHEKSKLPMMTIWDHLGVELVKPITLQAAGLTIECLGDLRNSRCWSGWDPWSGYLKKKNISKWIHKTLRSRWNLGKGFIWKRCFLGEIGDIRIGMEIAFESPFKSVQTCSPIKDPKMFGIWEHGWNFQAKISLEGWKFALTDPVWRYNHYSHLMLS